MKNIICFLLSGFLFSSLSAMTQNDDKDLFGSDNEFENFISSLSADNPLMFPDDDSLREIEALELPEEIKRDGIFGDLLQESNSTEKTQNNSDFVSVSAKTRLEVSCLRALGLDPKEESIDNFLQKLSETDCYMVNYYMSYRRRKGENNTTIRIKQPRPIHVFQCTRNSKRPVYVYLFLRLQQFKADRHSSKPIEDEEIKNEAVNLQSVCLQGLVRRRKSQGKVCVNPYHYCYVSST